MIIAPDMKDKAIGVFGLGVTGISVCDSLIASGARVFTWDESGAARKRTVNTEYLSEHPKQWPWKEMAAIVVSPGVPLTHPKPHPIVRKARSENIPVIGDTELFARAVNALDEADRPRIIAITGSNGKSTTTALIGHILRSAGENVHVGGNIGEPVLTLDELEADNFYVIEMSSFQLDLTYNMRANAAVFLNVTPDHIERHGNITGYVNAKKRIFKNQQKSDIAVIGVDDGYTQIVCTELTAADDRQVMAVSSQGTLGRGVYVLDGKLFYNCDGKTTLAGDLASAQSLRGVHNHQNAAAALAVCRHFGVAPAVAVKSMNRFDGLAHRMEEVGRSGKTVFINDSKATNAGAAARALMSYDEIYWIAGGKAKAGGAAPLRDLMGRVKRAYLIGEAAPLFEQQLGDDVKCIQCGDLNSAVASARADAAKSKAAAPVVLFSPACASYDQFKNFEERGDAFRDLASGAQAKNGQAA